MTAQALAHSPAQFHGPEPTQTSRNICLKAFVIFVIAIGAIAIVSGVLALLASQGLMPEGLNSISKLTQIGLVNSSLMLGGGTIIFLTGIAAWTCHLRKEHAIEKLGY